MTVRKHTRPGVPKHGKHVTFASPSRYHDPYVSPDEDAGDDGDAAAQLDHVYGLCNQLVGQLTQVTNAYEAERVRRLKAEEERDKLQLDKVKFYEACQKAGRQIEADRDFIRDALQHAMEQDRIMASLKQQLAAASRAGGPDSPPTPQELLLAPPPTASSSDAISRLAHIEQMTSFLKRNAAAPLPAP